VVLWWNGGKNSRLFIFMPFKRNAARRHRIGEMKFKATNWRDYEAGLRRRGSLTLRVTGEASMAFRNSPSLPSYLG